MTKCNRPGGFRARGARNAALINRSGVYDGWATHDFDRRAVRDTMTHLVHPGDTSLRSGEGRTEPTDPADGRTQGKYGWARRPRCEIRGEGAAPLEVGPLARQVIAGRHLATFRSGETG